MESKIQFRNQLKFELRPLLENFSGSFINPIIESKLQDKFGQEFSLSLRVFQNKVKKVLKEAAES